MDRIIADYNYNKKGKLNYCYDDGVAYQIDMTKSVDYDQSYFKKYLNYEKNEISHNLNSARRDAVKTWMKNLPILDIGIGCGTFIKYMQEIDKSNVYGYDINHTAVEWLKNNGIFYDPYNSDKIRKCLTFWDSLEHISRPSDILDKVEVGMFVFVSIPIFDTLEEIKHNKHYRPDEHYYYFTKAGFLKWMIELNFKLIRFYDFETANGRESIETFLLEKTIDNKARQFTREALKRGFNQSRSQADGRSC